MRVNWGNLRLLERLMGSRGGDVRNELESHDPIYAQTGFHFLPGSQGQDVAIILLRDSAGLE